MKKKVSEHKRYEDIARLLCTLSEAPAIRELSKSSSSVKKLLEAGEEAKTLLEFQAVFSSFNDHFIEYGWIAYGRMNRDLITEAVLLARDNEIEKAEELITSSFDQDTIRFRLIRMRDFEPFRARNALADLALEDYVKGRYYSSVLLLLTIIDGIVCDTVNRTVYSQDTSLDAWDCFASRNDALNRLFMVIRKTRKPLNKQPITIPYRNGIIHGRDINFNNRAVAAKCWNLMFAVYEWAVAVKEGRGGAETSEDDFVDIRERIVASKETLENVEHENRLISQWQPRSEIEISRIIALGKYPEDSPEFAADLFMQHWMSENYGGLASRIAPWSSKPEKRGEKAGRIRKQCHEIKIRSYKIANVIDEAVSASAVSLEVTYEYFHENSKPVDLRMLYLDPRGRPLCRGVAGGLWQVHEISLSQFTP